MSDSSATDPRGKDTGSTAGGGSDEASVRIYWEGFSHGVEAAAKFIEDCRDYGWESLAAHIREMAPPPRQKQAKAR